MAITHPGRSADTPPGSPPARTRSGRRPRRSLVVQRVALLVLVLLSWELVARWLDSRAIPTVGPVLEAMVTTVPSAAFWSALASTLQSWSLGMLVAMAVGIPLGLLIGADPVAMRATRGVVEFLRTVPAIMLVPLAVLVLGSTIEMKVLLISISVVWPLLVHASYGIRDVDAVARDSATVFGLRRRERILFLYLPSALPVIATGVRIAATVALLISIGAEIVTSAPGIGYEISLGQANDAAARSFVYVLLCGLLGVTINLGFGALERRTMSWHASQRRRGDS